MKKSLFLLLLVLACTHLVFAEVRIPFIANHGQVDENVAFYTETYAGTVFVTQEGDIVYSFKSWVLAETLVDGKAVSVRGKDRAPTRVNYLRGNDPARVPQFG